MALAQAYVNEVLNHLPSTCVVDEQTWPILVKQLHYEDRDLKTLIIGQMKLRSAKGGYDGLQQTLSDLLKENEALRAEIERLKTPTSEPTPEPVHAYPV